MLNETTQRFSPTVAQPWQNTPVPGRNDKCPHGRAIVRAAKLDMKARLQQAAMWARRRALTQD